MQVLAIDPGSTQSGYVVYDTATSDVLESGVAENNDLVDRLHAMNQSVGIMLEIGIAHV